MNNHLERLNAVIKLQLGSEHTITEETAKILAQEVINDRYRKIFKDNMRFLDAIELLSDLKPTSKRGKK
jgi:hypothetical protein